jgi:hypothetical protein
MAAQGYIRGKFFRKILPTEGFLGSEEERRRRRKSH